MLSIGEIVKASNGKLLNGSEDVEIKGYKIDSRLIEKGEFYIPMIGEKVDGHTFINSVAQKGAYGTFMNKGTLVVNIEEIIKINPNMAIIEVEDTLTAMQDIARYNREKHMDIESIAITGSVGKTSTREMVASVLSQEKSLLVTQKNLNGHIGLPLSALQIENQDLIVLEAGIDFVGEMDILGSIIKPNIAAITNIGTSHIEKFKSQDVIYREKTNIANSLVGKKCLLLNRDDEYLEKYKNANVNILYYGLDDAENIKYNENSIEYDTYIYNKKEHIKINNIGNHNILNSLVAIKVAEHYNLSSKNIIKGIAEYKNYSKRMEKISIGEITLIDDTYNASASSTKSGLKTVNELQYKRHIAVLADILELGEYSKQIHEKLAEVFNEVKYDVLIAYGKDMKLLVQKAESMVEETYWFETKEEAENKVREIMQNGDVIYFKGSNSMRVNDIVENIKKDFVE